MYSPDNLHGCKSNKIILSNGYLDTNSGHVDFSGRSALRVWKIWLQFIGVREAAHIDNMSDAFSNDLMLENRRLHSNRNTWANEIGNTLKLDDDLIIR